MKNPARWMKIPANRVTGGANVCPPQAERDTDRSGHRVFPLVSPCAPPPNTLGSFIVLVRCGMFFFFAGVDLTRGCHARDHPP